MAGIVPAGRKLLRRLPGKFGPPAPPALASHALDIHKVPRFHYWQRHRDNWWQCTYTIWAIVVPPAAVVIMPIYLGYRRAIVVLITGTPVAVPLALAIRRHYQQTD